MMSRSTFAQIVGYVSIVWHLYLSYGCLYILGYMPSKEGNGKLGELIIETLSEIVFFFLIASVAMIVVSILLVVGVRKQRHRLVAPFIVVSTIVTFIHILRLFSVASDDTESDSEKIQVIGCLCYVAIWYPIFKMYKKMRYANKHPTSCPVNPHYGPYVAPTQSECHQPMILPEFSHCDKYVYPEVKAPAQQCVHPNVSKV